MRVREVHYETGRVLVVVCDKDEEAIPAIGKVLREERVLAARVTAVGGFAEAEVGWLDHSAHDYRRIPVPEQVEVLSLLGDVAEQNSQPALHLHTVLGRSDGSTVGGHLLRGRVWPTLEVIISEVSPALAKRVDKESGLALISGTGPEDR